MQLENVGNEITETEVTEVVQPAGGHDKDGAGGNVEEHNPVIEDDSKVVPSKGLTNEIVESLNQGQNIANVDAKSNMGHELEAEHVHSVI